MTMVSYIQSLLHYSHCSNWNDIWLKMIFHFIEIIVHFFVLTSYIYNILHLWIRIIFPSLPCVKLEESRPRFRVNTDVTLLPYRRMYTENGQQRFSSLRASQFSFNHVQIQSYITKLLDHSEIGTHAVVNRLVNPYLTLNAWNWLLTAFVVSICERWNILFPHRKYPRLRMQPRKSERNSQHVWRRLASKVAREVH